MTHLPYYDVSMPLDAAALICENVEWHTPTEIVLKVQDHFSAITHAQIHAAWTVMSKTIWKHDLSQLISMTHLLKEYLDDVQVDVFDLPSINGIEPLAFRMKKIAASLHGQIVEVGINATCKFQPPYNDKTEAEDNV